MMIFKLLKLSFLLTMVTLTITARADNQDLNIKIKGLENLSVPYKAVKKTFFLRGSKEEIAGRHPTDNSILEIDFPSLSEKDFDILQNIVKNKKKLKYQKGKSYKLSDFMPPAVQALNGLQFKPIQEQFNWPKIKDEDLIDSPIEIEELFLNSEAQSLCCIDYFS